MLLKLCSSFLCLSFFALFAPGPALVDLMGDDSTEPLLLNQQQEEMRCISLPASDDSDPSTEHGASIDAASQESHQNGRQSPGMVSINLSPELSAEDERKLEEVLSVVCRTNYNMRDKTAIAASLVLCGSAYYFLVDGVGSKWGSDVFTQCAQKSLSCFIWQNAIPSNVAKGNTINESLTANFYGSWSFYAMSRFLEAAERYFPGESVLRKFTAEKSKKFHLFNGASELFLFGMSAAVSALPAVSLYNAEIGDHTQSEVLAYTIPLFVFLSFEQILTYKAIKEELIMNHLLNKGETNIKHTLINRLKEVKEALKFSDPAELEVFSKDFQQTASGTERLKKLFAFKNGTLPFKNKSAAVHYAQRAAAVFALAGVSYVAYLAAQDSFSGLYDSMANGLSAVSPFYQMVLKYLETDAPNPDTSSDAAMLNWWGPCASYAVEHLVTTPECVDAFRNISTYASASNASSASADCWATSSFGPNCNGVSYKAPFTFQPLDLDLTADNARSWVYFMSSFYEGLAGTNSTDPIPPSEEATHFGNGAAYPATVFTASLIAFQNFGIVKDAAEVFQEKNRLFLNLPILTFCVLEAAFRTIPDGMSNYFYLRDNAPENLLYPLMVCSSLVIMNTYINYFFAHYKKLPGAVQQLWWLLKHGTAKVLQTTFEEPQIFYADQDSILSVVGRAETFIANADSDTLSSLPEILGIEVESHEEKGLLRRVRDNFKRVFQNL